MVPVRWLCKSPPLGILSRKLRNFTGSFFAIAKPVAAFLAKAEALPHTVAGIIMQRRKTHPSRDRGFFVNPVRFNVIPFLLRLSRFTRKNNNGFNAKTKPTRKILVVELRAWFTFLARTLLASRPRRAVVLDPRERTFSVLETTAP